nr:biotin-dependent carboxyltransferase family protein [uncultured Anaeromusa sp.]
MITVTQPGLLTTVQDQGRWGYQAYGVPVAGAMDRYACRAANILVGNEPEAAVLEMTLMGGSFQFAEAVWVAACGADMEATLDGQTVKNWSAFLAPAGSELTFGFAVSGCRSYLAVRGGFEVPVVLGSRSTYTRGRIGGVEGRALRAGDVLQAAAPAAGAKAPQKRRLPPSCIPAYGGELTLRVLLGPQDDFFTSQGLKTFLDSSYLISDEADRMGYRLQGEKIEHKGKADIVSDALCFGAIQVPGHGMPIVMMADRQTTGGYAKIGTVIGPDLALLAQAKPGDMVRFAACSEEEAIEALRQEQSLYLQMQDEIPTATGKMRTFRVVVNGAAYEVEVEEVVKNGDN